MKKITENNYMTVYSNLKINTCVQEENKLQDVKITYVDIEMKQQAEDNKEVRSDWNLFFLQQISVADGFQYVNLTVL